MQAYWASCCSRTDLILVLLYHAFPKSILRWLPWVGTALKQRVDDVQVRVLHSSNGIQQVI